MLRTEFPPPRPLISTSMHVLWKSNTYMQIMHTHAYTHVNTHMCELMLPPVFPWCVFHTPPLLPPWGVWSDAVCREQPCLSAAWSQMAWCGWLWLRLLSPPDHHMMNHIPAPSKTTHTHTHTEKAEPTRSQHSSERSQQEKQLSSSLVVHGD